MFCSHIRILNRIDYTHKKCNAVKQNKRTFISYIYAWVCVHIRDWSVSILNGYTFYCWCQIIQCLLKIRGIREKYKLAVLRDYHFTSISVWEIQSISWNLSCKCSSDSKMNVKVLVLVITVVLGLVTFGAAQTAFGSRF